MERESDVPALSTCGMIRTQPAVLELFNSHARRGSLPLNFLPCELLPHGSGLNTICSPVENFALNQNVKHSLDFSIAF